MAGALPVRYPRERRKAVNADFTFPAAGEALHGRAFRYEYIPPRYYCVRAPRQPSSGIALAWQINAIATNAACRRAGHPGTGALFNFVRAATKNKITCSTFHCKFSSGTAGSIGSRSSLSVELVSAWPTVTTSTMVPGSIWCLVSPSRARWKRTQVTRGCARRGAGRDRRGPKASSVGVKAEERTMWQRSTERQ